MKITIYELLGMIKDGKAPKKVKYDNINFEYDGIYYMAEHTYLDEYCNLSRVLNDEVEILEEEKKIPEKLSTWFSVENVQNNGVDKTEFIIEYANHNFETYFNKINEIINYLDYLKSKGE